MSEKFNVTLNTKKLKDLMELMGDQALVARVGVLGSSNGRKDFGSNATIGALHEFGGTKMPQRSWLRMPLTEKLDGALKNNGVINQDSMNEALAEKSFKKIVSQVAITAVSVILEGFDTGGFGKWKPSKMQNKKNKQTLVETTQLRDSVTWDVKKV